MPELEKVGIERNHVRDLSPLREAASLRTLLWSGSGVSKLTQLAPLTSLRVRIRSANTTPRSFAERAADFGQNPSNWEAVSIHPERSVSVRGRGGVSEQICYRNTQTGEIIWRHRVTNAKGKVIDDHPRPFYKARTTPEPEVGP